MGLFSKIMGEKEDDEREVKDSVNEFYTVSPADMLDENGKSKMILLEPRAYSESYQIIDHLKSRNAVVVNLKRVTPTQAKRIVDVLNGAVYALNGDIQKLGGGIFLCTPNNVNIQGKIEDDTKEKDDKDDLNVEW